LDGGGECGALMRAHDWSQSPMGEPASWAVSLKTLVGVMLNSAQPMCVVGGDERTIVYNDAYATLLEHRHPTAMGRPMAQVWWDIMDVVTPLLDRAYAGVSTTTDDMKFKMADAEGHRHERHFSFSYTPVREGDTVVGMFCACQEITEQLTTQQMRASERAKLLAMFDQAPGFMAILEGPDHRIAYANATYIERMGGRDAIGRTVAEAIPEAEEQGFIALFDKVYSSGEALRLEAARFVARLPDGSEEEQYVDVAYQPLKDACGEVSGIFIEGYSVTDRVKAEAEADARRARLESVMLAAPAAIYVSDRKQRRMVFANQGMTKLLGYSPEEICALPSGGVSDLFHPDHAHEAKRLMAEAESAVDGAVVDGQYRIRTKDGRYLWMRDRVTVLSRAPDGSVAQVLGVAVDIGEQISAEQALAARSRELEQIMSAAPAAIWIGRSSEGGAIEANAMGHRILGLDDDAPMGVEGPPAGSFTNGRFVHPDGRVFAAKQFPLARAMAGERIEGLEVEVAYESAPSRHLLINAQPFGEEKKGGAVAIGVEITERRRLEEELRALNADLAARVEEAVAERSIFANIIDETDAFVQVAATDFTYLAVNKASANQFARLFGIEPKAGDNFLEVLDKWPEHRDHARALWARAFAGESFTEVREFALRGMDRRSFESRFRPLRDAEGKVIAAYQFVTEITDRVRNEARLRTIFDTSFQFQGLVDLEGTLLEANRTSLEAIGSDAEGVIGKKVWDTAWFAGTEDLPKAVRLAVKSVIATKQSYTQETTLNLLGKERRFNISIRPMLGENGDVVGLITEATETTALRAAEAALMQAQKLEGMGQLTGGVAHDFNNLLTIILGGLDIIGRQLPALGASPAAERAARARDMAAEGAQRAAILTSRLLAFSRQQPLDPKPVDTNRLIAGTGELLHRTLGVQIALETVLAGGLWRIHTDANQLENSLLNLALNARDAMPSGGKLTIETANCYLDEAYVAGILEPVEPGQYVMIAVTDTGLGMSKSTQEKAFEPFFTTKEVGKGTGLGLSQVYGFVRQSAGHIRIYSELGEGTTVKIYLPRQHGGEEAPEPRTLPRASPRALGDELILVVEDDAALRAHVVQILAELGYHVAEAADGRAALAIVGERDDIDLLFTDIVMPGGLNGRELADQAQRLRPDLKVLFMTGYTRNAVVHHGRLDAGVHLIGKPFSFDALAVKIRALLDDESS